MRLKFLLFGMLLSCGILNAQDTIRSLIISEVKLGGQPTTMIELTNMGEDTVDLSEFELGTVGPWDAPVEVEGRDWTYEDWFPWNDDKAMMLPEVKLAPGESYAMSSAGDYWPKMHLIDPFEYGTGGSKKDVAEWADYLMHYNEAPYAIPADSIDPKKQIFELWNGRDCLYIRHHMTDSTSVVVDQVGGIFDEENGTSSDMAHDVAGVTDATNTHYLMRKFTVKEGNLDFENARGNSLEESEWIPIPNQGSNSGGRPSFWTPGNHGNYLLDETTLVPRAGSEVDVDWEAGIITVPWGVRRDDSLVFQFQKNPGLAWHYDYSPVWEDTAYLSVRTGDTITWFACGNTLTEKAFRLEVAAPTADANIVMPKKGYNQDVTSDNYGYYGNWAAGIYSASCQVTDGMPGMDTIKHINGLVGLDYPTRKDTLLKYLEKAPGASWEVIPVDGEQRAELLNGDILKVTAEDGSIKEYFIKVNQYRASHDANLSAITWPEMTDPDYFKGIYGWMGDTIPSFAPDKLNYIIQVPPEEEGIPALVATPRDLNAKVEIQRATNLYGTPSDRTVTITVTAEDDTTVVVYKVEMIKERYTEHIQPYSPDPFLSELVFWEQWNNGFTEVCNPGNQVLDLSDYMFFMGYSNNPAEAITWYGEADAWPDRFVKYIPGYKWQSEAEWQVEPAIAVRDLNINPLVQPGDVFVMGEIRSTGQSGYPWFASENTDIDFRNNPWDEEVNSSCARQWSGSNWYMYKILNDSIKLGLKPALDPNDFELIETFGMGDGSDWTVGGVTAQMIMSWKRKPEFYKGKTGYAESFGTNWDDAEWTMVDRPYYQALDISWPNDILFVADGIGQHIFSQPTEYMSTVSSMVYKATLGYSMEEEIRGIITGTDVETFMDNLIQPDTGQSLMVVAAATGDTLVGTDALTNGDTLVVLSADTMNISKYIIEVTDDGLSNDALLTSDDYTIAVDGATGTISGFDYGTLLKTVKDGVTVPTGATMTLVDDEDKWASLKILNFDTVLVDAQVSDKVFFEVIAEDGVTKVLYQLVPTATEADAFVTSSIYEVDQDALIVDLVPEGAAVATVIANLVPSAGADVIIVDKFGFQRVTGDVFKDDKIVVTSADGTTTNTYFLAIAGEETFLAYVVSEVYEVNQLNLTISLVETTEGTLVSELETALSAAPSATFVITDSEGTAKADDAVIVDGDLVVVTAGDGVGKASYVLTIVVGINDINTEAISVYPNPTKGTVNIAGLESGNRIQVYNISGMRIQDKIAYQGREVISLENQPNGMYFIVVSDAENVIGRYKLIRK